MTGADPWAGREPDAATPQQRIGLRLAYDGTAYSGWQFQPHARTVQGMVAAAIATIDPAAEIRRHGELDAIVNLSSSPFTLGKASPKAVPSQSGCISAP